MKRAALLLLFVIPFLYKTTAQTFQAGFYVGATMTDIAGSDNIDNDNDFYHLGFTIAGTVSTKISPKTRLQMEIRYFMKGTSQPPVVDSVPNSALNTTANGNYNLQYSNYYNLTLNYVDVVIGIKRQIHFNLRHATTDKYGIECGVSIGSLLGYSYTVQSINYTMALNLIDVSPYVGLYYNVTPHFYIEGRYSNSVNSIIKQDGTNSQYFYYLYYGSWNNGHNLAFSLTLGFIFGGTPAKPDGNSPSPPPTDN